MNFLNLIEAKEIIEQGKNVTSYLRKRFNIATNAPETEIIEIAYDLQAGSYIKDLIANRDERMLYVKEIESILSKFVNDKTTLLDIGTGELTTLTLILNEMSVMPKKVLAFDLSWSRLIRGKDFYKQNIINSNLDVSIFVADIKNIPLQSKCIDVITSAHALEPNAQNLSSLIKELFRIAKKKLILFEPSYELNSDSGKKRMDELGYVKGIQSTVEKLGGSIVEIIPLKNVDKNNPTACYIIDPPTSNLNEYDEDPVFCIPGTNYKLEYSDNFLSSKETGLVFPVLRNIPILKNKYGILATANF